MGNTHRAHSSRPSGTRNNEPTYTGDSSGATSLRHSAECPRRSKLRTSSVQVLPDAHLPHNLARAFRPALRPRFAKLASGVKFTRYGGECYAFAMLAAGQIDLCVEPSMQPYDIVPLIRSLNRPAALLHASTAVALSGAAEYWRQPIGHSTKLRWKCSTIPKSTRPKQPRYFSELTS